jgi:hypothetical protein
MTDKSTRPNYVEQAVSELRKIIKKETDKREALKKIERLFREKIVESFKNGIAKGKDSKGYPQKR